MSVDNTATEDVEEKENTDEIRPLLVVSYNELVRMTIIKNLSLCGVEGLSCPTFLEAEEYALKGEYSGVIVELPTIIKAKGEEKIVAQTLTSFYPALRVRLFGGMIIPMIIAGDAKQAGNIKDFVEGVCKKAPGRRLREHKRHEACLPVIVKHNGQEFRSFTLNISWGGAFIVHLHPEVFQVGESISIFIQGVEAEIDAVVCQLRPWGQKRKVPGVGLRFDNKHNQDEFEKLLFPLLRQKKEYDKDRLVS